MTAVAIFARDPAGRVKTRLRLEPTRATRLYAAMLEDIVATVGAVNAPITAELWYADALGPDLGLARHNQRGGNLGARMEHAFETMLAKHDTAIVVGSDAPTLPPRCIEAAISALHDHDVVLGPSADGGYYLIGARRVPSFADVRWSSCNALADTLVANPGSHCVEPWYDVDRPEDLGLLAMHLVIDPEAAPATAAVFDSSVDEW